MRTLTILLLVLLPSFLLKAAELPDWALAALQSAHTLTPPTEGEYWTLLDRTQLEQTAKGDWRKTHQVVRLVLQQVGADDASIYSIDGEEKNTRIKMLHGWHRRGDGSIEKLDKENVTTLGRSTTNQMNRATNTYAFFKRVNRGDVVVFESLEQESNFFSLMTTDIISGQPTRLRVIELVGGGQGSLVLKPVGLEEWGLKFTLSDRKLEIVDIPQFRDERFTPNDALAYPYVIMGIIKDAQDPMNSWDSLARWYAALFREKAGVRGSLAPASELDKLQQVAKALSEKLTYRQVYLDPGRGWEPLAGAEVERRAYGDCKDMTACMAYKLDQIGVQVAPALTNIGSQMNPDPKLPTNAISFDHVIAAIPLAKSLGLKAEIKVGEDFYLLYDPTDRYSPLGVLGSHLKGRSLMICTDQGARWVTVPESAVLPAMMSYTLKGTLNAENGLSGTLDVEEKGNAVFLRNKLAEGNLRDLLYQLRETMDLPSVVDLEPQSQKLAEDGSVSLSLKVTWPSFLQRSAGGLRLPSAITGSGLVSLGDPKARQQPIWLEESPRIDWHLEIAGMQGLGAAQANWAWKDRYEQRSWKAVFGETLVCDFSRDGHGVTVPLAEREQGLLDWEANRKDYEKFLVNATFFYKL